jgi:hypothetical protein
MAFSPSSSLPLRRDHRWRLDNVGFPSPTDPLPSFFNSSVVLATPDCMTLFQITYTHGTCIAFEDSLFQGSASPFGRVTSLLLDLHSLDLFGLLRSRWVVSKPRRRKSEVTSLPQTEPVMVLLTSSARASSNSVRQFPQNALKNPPRSIAECAFSFEVLFPLKARHLLAKLESRASYDLRLL